MRRRITIYIDHDDDDSDYRVVEAWLHKWGDRVHTESYSSGGWEHIWDFEAPSQAIEELPKEWLCSSEWATPEIFKS